MFPGGGKRFLTAMKKEKHPQQTPAMRRAMGMMMPGEKDEKRVASIDLIREMAGDESGSERFLRDCRDFLALPRG